MDRILGHRQAFGGVNDQIALYAGDRSAGEPGRILIAHASEGVRVMLTCT